MPRPCTICEHPQIRDITNAIVAGRSLRWVATRFELTKSALDRHIQNHVPQALKKVMTDGMSPAQAAEVAGPVLCEMRRLCEKCWRILEEAETSKNHDRTLRAIREVRRTLEAIARFNWRTGSALWE